MDRSTPDWTINPGVPQAYSESESGPLKLQLFPAPVSIGVGEALTVDSLQMDLTDAASTFNVPDEWVHAIKYAALSYLLYGEGQIKDPVRAEYAEKRYQQAVDLIRDARSVIRLLVGGVPLPIDSIESLDASTPFWRNQSGPPSVAGVAYDWIAVSPGIPDQAYGISADVVQSAPIPQLNEYLQLGPEELDHLVDYVTHILVFKCGGTDFKSTFPGYDSFMQSVAGRKAINSAKIKYLTPMMGQAQVEQAERPDRMKV